MAHYKFPSPTEYFDYYKTYIDYVIEGEDVLQLLQKQAKEVVALLKSLSAEKLNYAYADGKWTIKELLQHIIDTERIFSYRALSFARGEKVHLPGYDENVYARTSLAADKSLQQLLNEYQTNRAATICLFEGFAPIVHDKLGKASDEYLSVRSIVYILAGHEMHHLKVIREKYL